MFVLIADRIVTGDGKTVIENGAVAVNKEGLIHEVGEAGKIQRDYPDAVVLRKDGCTVMPGLVDMHVHIGFYDRKPDANAIRRNLGHKAFIAYKNMQDAMSVGITTLRSVAEPEGLGSALRAALHKDFFDGPRYFTCERGIAITGGHGTEPDVIHQDTVIEADGPWEVRKAIRQCIKDGADWIKILASHREHYCEYTLEELQAAADETHRFGKKCCIHAATRQAIEFAVEAGFDTIEHGAFLTPDLAQKCVEKGVAWIPTSYIYLYAAQYLKDKIKEAGRKPTKPELIEIKYFEDSITAYKKNFIENYRTGMLIGTGTDIVFPELHITPIAEEIETLCLLGLEPIEAIMCATHNGAKILGKEDEFGLVKPGLEADLVVVRGNPVENIKDIANVCEVYRQGKKVFEDE